jgi:hypothetical protein
MEADIDVPVHSFGVLLGSVLSDPEKKARLDRGESLDDDDGDGFDPFQGGPDIEQLFSMMFGGGMPFFMGGDDMMEFDEEEVCLRL